MKYKKKKKKMILCMYGGGAPKGELCTLFNSAGKQGNIVQISVKSMKFGRGTEVNTLSKSGQNVTPQTECFQFYSLGINYP